MPKQVQWKEEPILEYAALGSEGPGGAVALIGLELLEHVTVIFATV